MVQIVQAMPTKQTMRQQAFQQDFGGFLNSLGKLDAQMKDEQATERQMAFKIQEETQKLRQQGYDVTPDQYAQATGLTKDDRAPGRKLFDGLFGDKKEQAPVDLYGKRTKEWQTKQQQDAADKRFKRENEMLDREKTIAEINKLRNGGLNGISKGQEAADKDYAKNFNSFSTKGIVNTEATLNKLESIAKELEDDQGFGEASGTRLPLPDFMRSSDAIRRRDDARNAANSTLKDLFGGALSDAERIAASQEYYNDKLGAKENAELLRGKIAQLRAVREKEIEKARYFQERGTVAGFNMNEAPIDYSNKMERLGQAGLRGQNQQTPYAPTNVPNLSPIQGAVASPQEIMSPQRTQLRQSRIQELKAKQQGGR